MKNPKKINIQPMLFPEDKNEIASWQAAYGDTPEFESIQKYILEGQTYYGLNEVIETNYEIMPIGDDERRLAFVAKSNDDEIIAWILVDAFDLNTSMPEMFVQYICIHPLYQNQGYGTEIAKEILLNAKQYIGVKPYAIFSYIHKNNTASMNLFKKFNFSISHMHGDYSRASSKEPKLMADNSSIEKVQ